MTRFIHDQFAKDYLEELLKPYGEVKAPSRVAGEVREIDVLFTPNSEGNLSLESLGLLGRFAVTSSIFEPFRNAVSSDEICDCLLNLLVVRGDLQREANRSKTRLQESDLPKLWILTPTASANILDGFGAVEHEEWLSGVHFMPFSLRTAIVVIHQLPRTSETLWLRLLGKGRVQQRAIDELAALPTDNLLRSNTLKLLYNLQLNLSVLQDRDPEDRDLIMRLTPFYEQEQEQAIQRGERLVLENVLRVRFGSLDEELATILEPLLALSPEEFTPLVMQLSREELLARFGGS
ncbi:hypothetical protein [Oscillatoria salina]|uniref:hypothetical protein n=1 Tax=Oscillatoria salina TaxID=331517 RepID=UPI001CCFC352|nr:hypothetical protein [Oscillatoria salina]MBZ8182500.1 hypothetical protein [Oscillatoria salina IIICB1]